MQILSATGLSDADFSKILSFLRQGGVIGFPTDTAYGLAADALNEQGVGRIYEIKGRSESKPILLLVDSMEMLYRIAAPSETANALADRFWPGPLTLVMPAHEVVPPVVTAGTGTVAVRWPAAEFPMRLMRTLRQPVTATSANRSGYPTPVTADEVRAQLEGKLEILVDGGLLPARSGSTLLDLTVQPPLLLREGPVSVEALEAALKSRILRPK